MNLPVTFTTRMRKKGDITIPAEIIKEFDLYPGIPLEMSIKQKGKSEKEDEKGD